MRRAAALAAALVPLAGGCGEALRPVLGGLEVHRPGASFQMPVLENQASPFRYPRAALDREIGGLAVLRIHITRDGRVDSVALQRSAGHPALDSAAVAGARQLRYSPARRGGSPVDVWATLPVRFPMPERGDRP